MSFRLYTNAIANASRSLASGIFIVGLFLIGFGLLIIALPQLFALLAASIFFIAGVGCATTAIKIFLTQRKIDKLNSQSAQDYRQNVSIHNEGHCDL